MTEPDNILPDIRSVNAAALAAEMDWLHQLITTRLQLFFAEENNPGPLFELTPPELQERNTYADFVVTNQLGPSERAILSLALASHLGPEILDAFVTRNSTYDKRFTEFGGAYAAGSSFIPTGQTVLFLLGGHQLWQRLNYYSLLENNQVLFSKKVLLLEPDGKSDSLFSSRLMVAPAWLHYFISGSMPHVVLEEGFPAKRITTSLEWPEVILPAITREGLTEIDDWIAHSQTLLNTSLGKHIHPGYKALFYGPPGTGKTLTASLLGKTTGYDVYRIDLSLIVSKFIGETERNLSRVFDEAADKNWILFFDEADALFGKRTEVSSSHDRYANQEVAYLLQRVEEHKGVVILATNLKDNIDKAFLRRFQSVVHFPMPGMAERLSIWQKSFADCLPPEPGINLTEIAEKYQLSGGPIINVIRGCSLRAIKLQQKNITLLNLENGIKKELNKEGIHLT